MAYMYYSEDAFKPDQSPAALVNEGWDKAQAYASTAFNAANAFLDEIGNLSEQIADLPDVIGNVSLPAGSLTPFSMPDAPDRPDGMAVTMPAAPSEPILASVVDFSVGNAPNFTATLPALNLDQALPGDITAAPPGDPELNAIVLPESPALVIPDMTDMQAVVIPDVPVINLPSFGAVLQEVPLPPGFEQFAFAEATYTSDLLSALKARLLECVNGASTGIAAAVEDAIWQRGRDREAGALLRKARDVIRGFAARGFSRPPGAMQVALAEASQAAMDGDVALSRDVMVKQAELEQSNRQFAFQQAWQVESGLISYASQIAQRAFESAKFALDFGIEVFKAQIMGYSASVEGFKARALVFETELKAELAHLEVFKAQIEAQKLVGELNLQTVEIYKARIAALQGRVEIFKAQVQAAAVAGEVNKTIVDAFVGKVQGYKATVEAKSAEYEGYATRIKAEVAKADVFKAQSEAYRGEVEGFKALVEAKALEVNSEIKTKIEAPMDLFKARTEVYRSGVSAEAERLRAISGVYQVDGQVYASNVGAQANRAQAEATIYKAEADVNVSAAQIAIEAAKANVAKMVQQVSLLSESIRAGAQVSAQLAAAALSAVNLSGGISTNEGFSHSDSNSTSDSHSNNFSISHIYSHKDD